MQEKSHLRTKFKNLRKTIDTKRISEQICQNIRDFECYKSAQNVMIFYPAKYEIDLLPLLNDNKNFYFPRVKGDELLVCPYLNDGIFEKSPFNIYEPCSNPVEPKVLDLIFVPALAADKNCYRLGYGGGFYDRFLPQCPNSVSMIPICEDFVVEELPVEKFDVKTDFVITNGKKAHC